MKTLLWSRLVRAVVVLCVAAAASNAWGISTYWWSPSGNWVVPSAWTNGVPTINDGAFIQNNGTVEITTPNAMCAGLYVGRGSSQTGTVRMTGGSLLAPAEYIGKGWGDVLTGSFLQSGGANIVLGELRVGWYGGGKYELGGTAYLQAVDETVGIFAVGRGEFLQSGGTNKVWQLLEVGQLADANGARGTYEIRGGRLDVSTGDIRVGGDFKLNGGEVVADIFSARMDSSFSGNHLGTLCVNLLCFDKSQINLDVEWLKIGHAGRNSTGSFSLNDSHQLSGPYGLVVGSTATATFSHHGQSSCPSLSLVALGLGESPDGNGTYELGNGALSVGWCTIVGCEGTGTFRQFGGSHSVGGYLIVGNGTAGDPATGRTATYELHDGELRDGDTIVGNYRAGTFQQYGGEHWVTRNLSVGCSAPGTYEVSGGILGVHGTIEVGRQATGTFTLSGGHVRADELRLGPYGTFSASGGELYVNRLTGFGNNIALGCGLALGLPYGTGQCTFSLDSGQSLNVPGLYIGWEAPTTFLHKGGTNTVSGLALGHSQSRYELSGSGALSAGSESIYAGEFIQTGGTNTTPYLEVGEGYSREIATYRLTGGVLQTEAGHCVRGLTLGKRATGLFYLGDANQTGSITSPAAGDLRLRPYITPDNAATFRGWGTVALRGTLTNNGRIIADGYGIDRTLDLSAFSMVTNSDPSGVMFNVVQGDGTLAGWYAENHGALRLPAIPLSAGGTAWYNWGHDPSNTTLYWVNSVRMVVGGASVAGPLEISLLALDRSDVPAVTNGKLIGAWKFTPPPGFSTPSAALCFRYDDRLASATWPAGNEADLRVYGFWGNQWFDISGVIDVSGHRIWTYQLDSLSAVFAVGRMTLGSSFHRPTRRSLTLSDNQNLSGTLQVLADTLTFDLADDKTVEVAPGALLRIAPEGTVELAGSRPALSDGTHHVDILNDSNAAGLRVLGGMQAVGAIDGVGTTTIEAGATLTASYLRQSSLVLSGTAGHPARLVIRPSGHRLTLPAAAPSGAGALAGPNAVPEPTCLALLIAAAAAALLGKRCFGKRRGL